MTIRHTLKYDHKDGVKLDNPTSWCGRELNPHDWFFLDAQHLALSAGGSVQPCKNCVKAVIKQLSIEL